MHTQCTHVFEEQIDLGFGKGIWEVDHPVHPTAEPCPVSAHFVEIGDIYGDAYIYIYIQRCIAIVDLKHLDFGHSLTRTVNVIDRNTQTIVSYTHGQYACVYVCLCFDMYACVCIHLYKKISFYS